ncbi:MAG: peptidoglycan DD-metalloendopeptidase family protein [Meiothermus sp.]|nr:peptidoglycan DD-metalloendopeptidase family protein [Meiothermus sp.]
MEFLLPFFLLFNNLAPLEIAVPPSPQRGWLIHRVQPGETLAALAARYGAEVESVRAASGLRAPPRVGDELRIPLEAPQAAPRYPPGVRLHRVRPGETLNGLARRYGVSALELVSANPGYRDVHDVRPGDVVAIPGEERGAMIRLAEGDDVARVARRFGLPLARLVRANGLSHPLELAAGDWLLLPGKTSGQDYQRLLAAEEEKRRQAVAEAQRRQARQRLAQERARQAALDRPIRSTVVARLTPANAVVAAGGYRWPLSRYVITTYFGVRGAFQRRHTGLDLAAPYGSPIYASRSGRVDTAGWSPFGYGIHVVIGHGEGVETLYAHMSSTAVRAGQWVQRGQVIGYVGSTGWSTGPHTHLEVRVGGQPRNPLVYLP